MPHGAVRSLRLAALGMVVLLLLLALSAALPPAGFAAAGAPNVFGEWGRSPSSLPDGVVPEGLIRGADRFLLIGSVGKEGSPVWFGVSATGANWLFTQVVPPQALRQIVYGDGRFIAHWSWEGIGDVATSADGASWEVRGFVPFPVFRRVLYGQGWFIGVEAVGGDLLYSADGATWLPVPGAPWRTGEQWLFSDLTYTGSQFITAGEEWDGNGNVTGAALYTSADGLNWESLTGSPPPCAGQIAYGNGRYLLLGGPQQPGISSSADGRSWTPCADPAPGFVSRWLAFVGGYFVLLDGESQQFLLSVDGLDWWSEPLPADAGRLLAAAGERVVLAGPDAIYTADFARPGLFTVGRPAYTAHGDSWPMDVAPFIQEDRTFVPVRYLADAVGVPPTGIGWDEATQTVTLRKGSDLIELTIGSAVMRLNGEPRQMDVAPLLIPPGRTMLPARFVAEALGYRVEWFDRSEMVLIRP